MKYKVVILIISLMSLTGLFYGQIEPAETGEPTPPTGAEVKKKDNVEYNKQFKEHFHKEDEFLLNADPKKDSSFFMIKKKKGKVIRVGYYTKRQREGSESDTLILTQYSNFEGLPFYYLKYSYNADNLLSKKEFKDEHDNVIAFYKYFWKKKELVRLEKWGKTKYLRKMELKSYNVYKWNGKQLLTFSFFNKTRRIVEKYHFTKNPGEGENVDPVFLVGNNRISMFVLKKYERFKESGKNRERSFYVTYKTEGNKMLQEKYNHDDVLIEEVPPIEIPQQSAEGDSPAPVTNP